MINREKDIKNIVELLDNYPVVGILGARQVGKATIRILEESFNC